MPRTDFNLSEWVKDLAASGNLTPQQTAALEESLKPVAGRVGESVLRQSEFDRFFNERKAEFERKEQSLASFQTTLQQHREQVDGLYKKALTRAEQAELDKAAFEGRLRYVGEQYNIPEEDLRIPAGAPPSGQQPPAAHTAPAIDTSKFIDDARYRNDLNTLARTPFYMASVADVEREHRQLFPDKPLSQSQIVEAAMAAKADPTVWWEKQYNIPEKRQEIRDAAREREWRAKWDTEQSQKISSAAIGVLNPNTPVGQVLSLRADRQPQPTEPGSGQARRNGAMDRVAAATSAMAAHKYSAENRGRSADGT